MKPVPTEVAAVIRGEYDSSNGTWKVHTTIETADAQRTLSHLTFSSLFVQTDTQAELYELVKLSVNTIIEQYGLVMAPIAGEENE